MTPRLLIALAVLTLCSTISSQETITVYSAGPKHLIDRLAADFHAATGIRADVFQGTTGQVMSRFEAERANPRVDVIISASWESADALKASDDLLEYRSPNAEHIPEFLLDSHYVAQGVSALALVWNTQSSVPRPSDWDDLVKPVYKNQVTMPDPAQSGSAFELVAGLLTAHGEDTTWQLFEDLSDNGMIIPGPNARALNPVLQGARSVVFGAVDYSCFRHADRGETIEVIFPESGTVAAPRPIMIAKSTSKPEAAQRFVDFVLSTEGQERVAEAFLIPARSDVPAQRPGLDEIEFIEIDRAAMNAIRGEILERFREATAR